jgi:hypothetical protein
LNYSFNYDLNRLHDMLRMGTTSTIKRKHHNVATPKGLIF